jgi:tRNA dimethylallyltransferase
LSTTKSKTNSSVVLFLGPTAVGKTAVIAQLRHLFGGVIYADTGALYRDLIIGTAKPSAEEIRQIPHYLLDRISFHEAFDAARFVYEADAACRQIHTTGALPLLAGGSLFYLNAFIFGQAATPKASVAVRAHVAAMLQSEGAAKLYDRLMRIDPTAAERININDHYRLTRALEVYYDSGCLLSSFKQADQPRECFNFIIIILNRSRDELYARINSRVETMFDRGLKEEVEQLKKAGASAASPGMKAIGYAEWFDPRYISDNEIKEAIKQNSRRYAKRQLTFLRRLLPYAHSCAADDIDCIEDIIKKYSDA